MPEETDQKYFFLVGVSGDESNNNLIENNQVERMRSYGIVLIYARDNEIIQNRIAKALIDGIVMDIDTLNTIITGNTITENGVGTYVYEGAVGNTAHNNNILSNST